MVGLPWASTVVSIKDTHWEVRGSCVPRTIDGFCTSCGSTKLFQRTSTSDLWFVFRSTRTL